MTQTNYSIMFWGESVYVEILLRSGTLQIFCHFVNSVNDLLPISSSLVQVQYPFVTKWFAWQRYLLWFNTNTQVITIRLLAYCKGRHIKNQHFQKRSLRNNQTGLLLLRNSFRTHYVFWSELIGKPPVKNQNQAHFPCFVQDPVPLFNHMHSGSKTLNGSVKTQEWGTES